MQYYYEVETQGLSRDWRHATGECESLSRGRMSLSDVENALKHVVDVDLPDTLPEAYCPPSIAVATEFGLLHFSPVGRNLFCREAGRLLGFDDACAVLRGGASPGMGNGTQGQGGGQASGLRRQTVGDRGRGPSVLRRLFGFVLGVPLVLFGVLVVVTGMVDNNLEGGLVGGTLFILAGLFVLWRVAFRAARTGRRGRSGSRGANTTSGYMHNPYMYGPVTAGDVEEKDDERNGESSDGSGDSGESGGSDD